MKKVNVKQLISVAISVAVMTIGVNLATNRNSADDFDKALEVFNKKLPQELDEYTRLDSIGSPSEKTLIYNITVNIDKEEADFESIKEYVHSNILENIKSGKELRKFREAGFTWQYRYNDKNGVFFHEFIVTPDMYK